MRRWMMLAILLSSAGDLVLPDFVTPAGAQPFGFFFGNEPRAHRPRLHQPRARPGLPITDIPLPVPRPRFDQETATETVAKPEAPSVVTEQPEPKAPTPREAQARETEAQEISRREISRKETTATVPPEPPAKPAELGGSPQPSALVPAPAAPPVPGKTESTPPVANSPPLAPAASSKTESAPPLTVPVPAPSAPPLPPPKPAEVGPPNTKPDVAASGATTATSPRQPDDDSLCPGRLKAQSVMAEPIAIGPQPDARCTVVQAVRLTGLTLPDGGGTIDFPDRPVIACATAESFSAYVRDLLSPLAKGTYGARLGAVWTGPGLECRSRDHIFGAKLSAHGQGLAVDVAQLKLADDQAIAVGEPKTLRDSAFETAARAGGCGYFHTVLGPGSDSYHRTHWHFDLEVRGAKGDTKFCH